MLPRDADTAVTAIPPAGVESPPGRVDAQSRPNGKTSAMAVTAGPDIQKLTRAARRGDAGAFSELYDLYSLRVYRFLLVLARGDEQAAREVCQAVFIKLSKRCDVFAEDRSFWAWVSVLAKNTFIDHWRGWRRQKRFVRLDEFSAEPEGQLSAEHRLAEMLAEAMATLPAEERELLQAAYVDGRPLRELADEAGQSYKAIESRLGRLRQRLKEQLLKNLRHENGL